ncbi:hypothetical protein DPMN_119682 [Dreissena polymorpha]|uniref:Uncharacterized protein n=1 Tax=Dreissena polymorpha TaxID=45954 RepID=A0A9D4GIK8_DREPO|nr:hypothetical protein DPMN_119682 [Dreissena polymorpha]
MDIELKDIGTRNWVKTWLALRCFKDAILPFMKDKCAEQYLKDISYIKHLSGSKAYTCNLCKVDELKPPKKKKTNKVCPDKGSCGYLCDRIIDLHVKNDPNWSNTNSEFWSDDTRGPWERIKCFIHTSGYKEKKDISEADITAFVQICTSNELLKTAFGTDLECLEKVRDIRNGMCHSGSMAVSGIDFLTYVRLIEKALKLTIFDGYPSANEELKKLHTLEHDNGKVTIEDEMTAREETIEAIREVKKMLEQQVSTDHFKKEIANLKSNEDEHIRLLEQRFIYIEKHLLTLQEDHTKNKTRLEEHKKILSNIQNGIAAQHTTINEIAVDAKKI